MQGGLTDLWLDDPYVLAAKKLIEWATAENEAGEVFPVSARSHVHCAPHPAQQACCCTVSSACFLSTFCLMSLEQSLQDFAYIPMCELHDCDRLVCYFD